MFLHSYPVVFVLIYFAAFVQGENNKTLNEGESLELTYRYETPFDISVGCRWTTPSGSIILIPGQKVTNFDGRPPTWTAEYYGDKEYDCGIRINSVDRRDEGTWETQGKVLIKYFISVNVKPESPPIFKSPPKFASGSPSYALPSSNPTITENVTCEVSNVRPQPTFTWIMDGQQFNTSSIYYYDNFQTNELFVSQSLLAYSPRPSHDGKKLRCVITHPALDGELEVAANISVFGAPDPDVYESFPSEHEPIIGKEATINIKFVSNPPPFELLWFTPDLFEPIQGGNYTPARSVGSPSFSFGRYTAYISKIGEGNEFLSTLTLDELTQEDVGQNFTLMVTNAIGSANYSFEFMNVKNRLSGGAITGIVIACLAAVAVIGIVIFLIVKKKKKSGKGKFNKKDKKKPNVGSEIPIGGFPGPAATDD